MEIQHAGYLTLEAKKRLKGNFPVWIVNNWGNVIYLFGRLADHVERIKEVLATCDYYACECQRDVLLAQQMGLKGKVLPVWPNAGGFDLDRLAQFRQPGPTSARRLILLKGYQHWSGRALVGLRALALCADSLRGYRIGIYRASNDVKLTAELVSQTTGLPIEVIPYCSHDDMLRWYGQARISIGLSISDAISTSLLEAMVMGAFPIQSCTSCCDEWIVDGETGAIVPPEDPGAIAAAIRRAVSDDQLVDRAAELNARVACQRLDQTIIRPQVIAMYERIAAEAELRKKGGMPK
jgi:glycosyltransferase involved in cell wall biosynthesis